MIEVKRVAEKIRLADARAELRVSVVALAQAASVSRQAVVNAEKGRTIQRITAHAILKALNAIRHDNGKDPLGINDIEWKIQGD